MPCLHQGISQIFVHLDLQKSMIWNNVKIHILFESLNSNGLSGV